MRTWDLVLDIEAFDGEPLYKRLARVMTRDIERGRLKPGERLSSTRTLAEQLGVNRNTVVAAFEELRLGGWIEGRTTSGTFVVDRAPTVGSAPEPPAPPEPAPPPGFDLPEDTGGQGPIPRSRGLLLLLGGVPDLRLLPSRELARAYRQVLQGARGRRAVDYAEPQGNERLRIALGELLARTRGIRAPPDAIAVVRGSQHGLFLATHALLRRGDLVAVETPGFPPAWRALELAGAEPVPIPVDRCGLDVDRLAERCARQPIRAVVVTPHHQHPTTVTLATDRRRALLELAARHRLMVIEDDYDFEFHYDGPPVLPLAASDRAGVVVYVATLSKSLAPGLRLGYVVGHPEAIRRIANYRRWVDQQGDHVVEQAVARLLEDGVLQRHTRRVRRIYRARRDALVEALRERIPDVEVEPPSGGMAVWARVPGVDATAWASRALEAGVAVQPGGPLAFDGVPDARDRLRIGFAACTEAELAEAVGRMASALPAD